MELALNSMDPPVDNQWLARYREGDAEALSEVVEKYRRPLYAFIIKMTEGRDEADEIFQEVWFRAIRKMDRFHNKNVLSWLFRIAHNLVIDRARKKKPDYSLQQHDEDHLALEDRLESPQVGPESRAAATDLGQRIQTAVQDLPTDQKAVFLMRMEGDLPFKEIARIQKVSINTALARMQYALAKLRLELEVDYRELSRY